MKQYPIGGPRQPVYDLMRSLDFSMAKFSDKTWTSRDGITVQIYGAGSMARVSIANKSCGEYKLNELSTIISSFRTLQHKAKETT